MSSTMSSSSSATDKDPPSKTVSIYLRFRIIFQRREEFKEIVWERAKVFVKGRKLRSFCFVLILAVSMGIYTDIGNLNRAQKNPSDKISPALRKLFENYPSALPSPFSIFIDMRQGTEQVIQRVTSVTYPTRGEKITAMKSALESFAESSQSGVRSILTASNTIFESFWMSNRIYVRDANKDLIGKIAEDPDVDFIRLEEMYSLASHEEVASVPSSAGSGESWGMRKIQAKQAWNLPHGGNDARNVVVSTIDSGVRYTHEALRQNFRNDGYGWFDAIGGSPTPIDEKGHGTHTMGILVGANGIGVAPGAEWISCRGCNGTCSESALEKCGEWIFCPTLADGSNENCSKAPNLVSNSWACKNKEDCSYFEPTITLWHEAEIIPILAIGNTGPGCGTARSPADLENVITVGATDIVDSFYIFSARGPSQKGLVKPDISAPGVFIRSAWNRTDNDYHESSGTSMAAPHVAGVVALLLGEDPSLKFNEVKSIVIKTADTEELREAESCGGIPHHIFPNNIYGHGRVNAKKSLEYLVSGRHKPNFKDEL